MKYFSAFALITVFIFSCKDSSNPVFPINGSFVYPLAKGNSWSYEYSIKYLNVQPDSLKQMFSDYTLTGDVLVAKKTTYNSEEAYELQETTSEGRSETAVYTNRSDGLFKLTQSYGGSNFLPKTTERKRFKFKDITFNTVDELLAEIEKRAGGLSVSSVNYLEEPVKILPYPMEEGISWERLSPAGKITNEIIGREQLSTPFGNFICFKIRRKYYLSNTAPYENLVTYKYISQKGLHKFVTFFNNITVTSDTSPDSLGTIDIIYEKILTKVNF